MNLSRLKAVITMSIGKLANAGLSFGRNYVITKAFGVNAVSDAYVLTLNILGMFGSLFSHLCSSILLPLYNNLHQQKLNQLETREKQNEILQFFFSYFFVISIVLSVVVYFNEVWVVQFFGGNASQMNNNLFRLLIKIALPASMLFQMAAAIRLVMLRRQQYSALNKPELIAGAVFIAGFIVFEPHLRESLLLYLIPVTQGLTFLLYWRYLKLPLKFRWNFPYINKTLILLPSSMFLWFLLSANGILENYYLSKSPAGSLTLFRYASTMTSILNNIVISAPLISLTPAVMAASGARDFPVLKRLMGQGLKEIMLTSLAVLVAGYLLSPLVMPLLFKRGKFTAEDVQLMITFFETQLWCMPLVSIHGLLHTYMTSLEFSKTQIVLAILSIGTRVFAGTYAMEHWGVMGFMWSLTIQGTLITIATILYIHRQLKRSALQEPAPIHYV